MRVIQGGDTGVESGQGDMLGRCPSASGEGIYMKKGLEIPISSAL